MEIIQQMSIDARLISDRMAVLPEGAIITYETIESVAGRNREKLRGAITTALREQLRHGRVFCGIRMVGYQRIGDTKKVDLSLTNLKRVRKVVAKSKRILEAVDDFSSLPNTYKVQHNAAYSMCGTIEQFTRQSSVKRIEDQCLRVNSVLPFEETLKQFS